VSRSACLILYPGILIALSLNACAVTPAATVKAEQHTAVERWNLCVERHAGNQVHVCEGHRRDVINAYPSHLANQVDILLSQRAKKIRAIGVAQKGHSKLPQKPEKQVTDYLDAIISGAESDEL
jgi:hypothetical protein